MGKGVKKERNSCLFKEYNQLDMQVEGMCNACYEFYKYGPNSVRRHALNTIGVCLLLYPNTKENWTPYESNVSFWYDRLGKNSTSATTTTNVDAASVAIAATGTDTNTDTVIKRKRTSGIRFVAEPGSGKMDCERQISLSRQRTNRRSRQNIEAETTTILSRMDALPKRVQNAMFSPFLDRTRNTREGRTCIAQKFRKMAGNSGTITLSTKGTSDTAVSLSKKTFRETQEGVALLLNPLDPTTTLQRMKGRSPSPLPQAYIRRSIQELQTVPEEVLPQPPDNILIEQGLEDKPRWRDRYSMNQVSMDEIEAVRNDCGPLLLEKVRSLLRPSDRRPFLAGLHGKGHTRAAVTNGLWMEEKITKSEWNKIGIHNRWPGPFEPVEKEPIFRARVHQDLLIKLLRFLDSPGNLQKYTFGTTFGALDCVELAKVDRIQSLKTLATRFVMGLNSEVESFEQVPLSEERYTIINKETFYRCKKKRDHEGKCKFTVKGSVSFTTAKNLVESLTSTDMVALSGLDDVKVEKGRDNFIALRDLAKEFSSTTQEAEAMTDRIDNQEIFYQTDYMPHLQRHGTNWCNCLTCGFHDKKQPDDMVCQFIDDHEPSCTKCTDGFAIICDLKEAIERRFEEKQADYKINYNLK